MSVKKVDELFYVKIDSNRDVYNASGFEVRYVNDETNAEVIIQEVVEEIILSHDGHTATNSGTTSVGSKVMSVSSSDLVTGDVILVLSDYYYIKEVVGNELHLYTPIITEIPNGTSIAQVGNSGIYRVPITIPSIGYYTIIILNDGLNVMNRQASVKIIPEDITDAHTKLDDITSKVDTLTAERSYVAFV